MVVLGIEENRGLIYEGSGTYGHGVWPAPVITPAKIVFETAGPLKATGSNDCATSAYKFREDAYDPIARIRRGRFYSGHGVQSQPKEWFLQPHPALPFELRETDDHKIRKRLHTFNKVNFYNDFIKGKNEQPLVLLGIDDRFTVWTVVDVEAISTGEDLVTLKSAMNSFGILPKYNTKKIDKKFRAQVVECLDTFTDEVYRSAPVSVIDRARDAASQILLAYFKLTGKEVKDLSRIAELLSKKDLMVAANSAHSIARLHSRAKPSEKHRRKVRPIREQDAEFAVKCVGIILCEIGWADWI
jgi:hypothetical protein